MAPRPVTARFICDGCMRRISHRAPLPWMQTRSLRIRPRSSSKSPSLAGPTPAPAPLTSSPPPPPAPFEPSKPATTLEAGDALNWYWETFPPTLVEKAAANQYFTKFARPEFLRSAALFRQVPASDVPEVAFVGRSNVGKSSLLNALVNADIKKETLARTGKKPGITRTINIYGVGPRDGVHIRHGKNNGFDRIVGVGGLALVDLPGYGEGSLTQWGPEIMKYLSKREELRRVFVLIDARVGLKDNDRSLLASLRLAGVSHQVILSKCDKVYIPPSKLITAFDRPSSDSRKPRGTAEDLKRIMAKVKEEIKPNTGSGALGELLAASSEVMTRGKRLGIDSVRVAVMRAAGLPLHARTASGKLIRRTLPGNAVRTVQTLATEEERTKKHLDERARWRKSWEV